MLPQYPRSRLLVSSTQGIGPDGDRPGQPESTRDRAAGKSTDQAHCVCRIAVLSLGMDDGANDMDTRARIPGSGRDAIRPGRPLGRSLDEYGTPGSASRVE